jgi:hypothetical protein
MTARPEIEKAVLGNVGLNNVFWFPNVSLCERKNSLRKKIWAEDTLGICFVFFFSAFLCSRVYVLHWLKIESA